MYFNLFAANTSVFSKETYEIAIEFFQRKNDKQKVFDLEHAMLYSDVVGKCGQI